MEEKLFYIPKEEWCKLRDLYLKDWPNNMMAYYTLDNYIKWIEKDPTIENLFVYSLNGDWSDGTFVLIDLYIVYPNSLNVSADRLTKLLSLLDWSNGMSIGILPKLRSALDFVVESNKLVKGLDRPLSICYMPQNKAATLDIVIPNGLTLKSLAEEHAEIIDAVWPFRHAGSVWLVKRVIALNINIGIFDENGKLLAWCLRFAGQIGALQVDEQHMGKGLGKLACMWMAKKIAEFGDDAYGFIVKENTISIRLFEKIGFTHIGDCCWMVTSALDTLGSNSIN